MFVKIKSSVLRSVFIKTSFSTELHSTTWPTYHMLIKIILLGIISKVCSAEMSGKTDRTVTCDEETQPPLLSMKRAPLTVCSCSQWLPLMTVPLPFRGGMEGGVAFWAVTVLGTKQNKKYKKMKRANKFDYIRVPHGQWSHSPPLSRRDGWHSVSWEGETLSSEHHVVINDCTLQWEWLYCPWWHSSYLSRRDGWAT